MSFKIGDKIKIKPGIPLTPDDVEMGFQHDIEYEVDASYEVLGFCIIGIKGVPGNFKPHHFVLSKTDSSFVLEEIDE